MPPPAPNPPPPTPPPPARRLLTRDQVLAALRAERDSAGLSATARKYGLSPQALWNVLEGGIKMSRGMLAKCRFRVHEFMEKVEEPKP